jgi:Putative polyhydroxyalkanoic acid system protein (PHA_gran_rgn)
MTFEGCASRLQIGSAGEFISREDRGRAGAAVPSRMRLARARRLPHMKPRVCGGFQVSKPLIVSIPHHLGREEAARRIKSGLEAARTNYSALLTIREETWTGDRLAFNLSALGQSAVGLIDVADDHVRLEVQLPWLLGMVAEKLTPAIRKEGTLMLEKK